MYEACRSRELYLTKKKKRNLCVRVLMKHAAGWSSETRNRTFECRFLVKPPDDKEETMEEKQQRVSKYETMQICSALLPSNGASSGSERLEAGGGGSSGASNAGGNDVSSESSDIGPCVMCVARRISLDEKRIGQFTLKLDTYGKIIAVDTSWLSPSYSQYLSSKVRECVTDRSDHSSVQTTHYSASHYSVLYMYIMMRETVRESYIYVVHIYYV